MIEETVDGPMIAAARPVVLNTFVKPEAERDPQAAEEGKKALVWHYEWLDRELEGREYMAGTFSLADIGAVCGVGFALFLSVEIPPTLSNLKAWHERVTARPSVAGLDS